MFYLVLLVLGVLVFKKFIYRRIFPKKPLDFCKLGDWAVVTGATDGIGKAFVEELASRGLNIVLISRNMEKLEEVAKEITNKYNVSVKAIQVEFTLQDDKMYDLVRQEVGNVEVGVLVNNVGMGLMHLDYHHELEDHQQHVYQAIVNCNVVSAVKMCQFVLPGMVSRQKGLIINVSSMFDEFSCPFQSMYGSTKAFLSKFSKDLSLEVENLGVRVHLLRTGMVATKMLGTRKTSWMVPSATTYVKSALSEISSLESTVSTGYISHTLIGYIISIMFFLFPRYSERKLIEIGTGLMNKFKERCNYCNPATEQSQNGHVLIS